MSEKVYAVPAEWKSCAFINDAKYKEMYARSVSDPDGFPAEHGKAHRLDQNLHQGEAHLLRSAQCFDQMVWSDCDNVSMNCIDRHLAKRGDQVAIIWEGRREKLAGSFLFRYQDLHRPKSASLRMC